MPPDAATRRRALLTVLTLGLVMAVLGSILVANVWLALEVPLTAQDLKLASWAYDYSLAAYLAGPLGIGLGVWVLLMSMATALLWNTPTPLPAGWLVAIALFGAGSETITARIGIAAGVVKIGCFVYEARECREQIGIPAGNAPSRYADNGQDAEWYLARRREALPHSRGWWHPVPGASVLAAPVYAWHADELRAKLAAQRAEVEAFRAKAETPN